MSRRVMWYAAIFIIAVIGSGTYWYGASFNTPVVEPERIAKPQTDSRQYERVTLENGLDLLVISDPSATTGAVALRIHSGSWHNPLSSPGLAHLASEVLFLKGDTLSKANPFRSLVQKFGGALSVDVSGEATQFQYDIDANALSLSLDALSAALGQPNWNTLDMSRGVARLDAAYQTNRNSDAFKRIDAQQTALNQAHPAARFAEGNLETLQSLDLELLLRSFIQDNYTPDNMALVVLSNQSTEDTLALLTDKFGTLQGKKAGQDSWPDYYNNNQLPAFLQIVPSLKDGRTLTFSFPVISKKGADQFIQYLFQQMHSGSLKERLSSKGWITDLSAGLTRNSGHADTFDIQVQLTRAGEKAIMEVGTWVFDSLQLIAQRGVPAWQLNEYQSNQLRRFNYLEMADGLSTVSLAAKTLGRYSENATLSGPVYNPNLDAIAIAEFVKYLKVDHLMLTWESPSATASDKTAFYQADFDLGVLPVQWAQTWSAAGIDPGLLPALSNPFVPKTLQQNAPVMSDSTLYSYMPDVRIKNAGMSYYYLNNDGFNSPRSSVQFRLESPWFSETTANRAATTLYLESVKDAIAPMIQQASAAGLYLRLWQTDQGVEFQASGFQASLGILTNIVADALISIDPTSSSERLRSVLRQQVQLSGQAAVAQQLDNALQHLLIINQPTPAEMDQALSRVSINDLVAVQQHIQSGSHLSILITGNILPDESDALAKRLQESFAPEANSMGATQVAKLDRTTAHWPLTNPSNDSALLMYFQGEGDSYRERALYRVMGRLITEDFKTALRDNKQLGTILSAKTELFALIPGLSLQIQSPSSDPGLLLLHVDKFLKDYLQALLAMDPKVFNAYRDAAIAQLVQPEHSLSEQATNLWRDLRYQVPHLNMNKRLALEIEKISHTGFIRFYQNQILNSDARRIVIYQAGLEHQEAVATNYQMQSGDRVVSSTKQYQSKRPVYNF